MEVQNASAKANLYSLCQFTRELLIDVHLARVSIIYPDSGL